MKLLEKFNYEYLFFWQKLWVSITSITQKKIQFITELIISSYYHPTTHLHYNIILNWLYIGKRSKKKWNRFVWHVEILNKSPNKNKIKTHFSLLLFIIHYYVFNILDPHSLSLSLMCFLDVDTSSITTSQTGVSLVLFLQ